jgi:hypothetical protein
MTARETAIASHWMRHRRRPKAGGYRIQRHRQRSERKLITRIAVSFARGNRDGSCLADIREKMSYISYLPLHSISNDRHPSCTRIYTHPSLNSHSLPPPGLQRSNEVNLDSTPQIANRGVGMITLICRVVCCKVVTGMSCQAQHGQRHIGEK